MLPPKAPKMRAIKHTPVALIADSTGGTKYAPAQMPWHLRHLNPALLNRQGMSTHPKMENGSALCHWKGQLVIGLRANPVRPRKPPKIGADDKLPGIMHTIRVFRVTCDKVHIDTSRCGSSALREIRHLQACLPGRVLLESVAGFRYLYLTTA